MKTTLLMTVLLAGLSCGFSARILAVIPFPGKSHYIFMSSVLKTLLRQGHEVVEYSAFPPSEPVQNLTHFEVKTTFGEMIKSMSFERFQQMTGTENKYWVFGFREVWGMNYKLCEEVLASKNIQKLLKSNEHFDLVVVESSFGQESMVVFGHKFNSPVVTVQGFTTWSCLNRDAGNSLSMAFIPDFTTSVTTDQMSFTDRFFNSLSSVVTMLVYYNFHLPAHEKMIKSNYREDIPPLVDMVGNVSLYLTNAHPAVEYPQPYTPNIVPIAGITITPDSTPLPQELQKFMDESKEGVIFFSFGTVVPAHHLPAEVVQSFVTAFQKLPYKVLWKTSADDLPGLSKNVKLAKWVPQPGILAHPNCVLFISHGGGLSQKEANFAGVPAVLIPFFGDQHYNTRFGEHRGVSVKLDYKNISTETILAAVNEVLKNPKYKENAVRVSRIFRDRPLSPAETTVFWVEYVLRHKGAHHLRSAATKLSWYQLALLDVVAVILGAVLAIGITFFLIIRKLMSLVFSSNKNSSTSVEKKDN